MQIRHIAISDMWHRTGRVAVTLALVLLTAAPVAAQVGTEPLAWSPEHRSLADAIGTAAVAAQVTAATVAAWRSPHRGRALLRELCTGGGAVGLAELLKFAHPETRPDGSDRKSWPSEHTLVGTALAGGWRFEVGVPVAAFIGLSRANANRHHFVRDVLPAYALGAGVQAGCAALIHIPKE